LKQTKDYLWRYWRTDRQTNLQLYLYSTGIIMIDQMLFLEIDKMVIEIKISWKFYFSLSQNKSRIFKKNLLDSYDFFFCWESLVKRLDTYLDIWCNVNENETHLTTSSPSAKSSSMFDNMKFLPKLSVNCFLGPTRELNMNFFLSFFQQFDNHKKLFFMFWSNVDSFGFKSVVIWQ